MKKKLFVVALVVCLLATISMGTLAWFSAQDEVENKFYVADSTDTDPEDIFSVKVTENTPDGDNDDDGYEYKDILPGDKLKKDVFVKNTGYYDQYIRVVVTISDATAWQAMLGQNFNDATLLACFGGFVEDDWTNITTEVTADNAIRVVMYYDGVLKSSDNAINVFQNVKIPETMTQTHATYFGTDGFTITVKAQAVQTENVGADAYAAFQTVGMDINA